MCACNPAIRSPFCHACLPVKEPVTNEVGAIRVPNPQIETAFTYHKPKDDQPAKYELLRNAMKEIAYLVDELVPAGRERQLALTKIEEASMWANAGIARNG